MGIPAHYGGFETCVEEVSTRLAKNGHEIIVYCGYRGSKPKIKSYKGIKLVFVPCLKNKFLDFPFRAFISTLDVLRRDVQIAHFYGSDVWPFAFVPRVLSSLKIVLTLDGLPWKRTSYPLFIRRILRLTAAFPLYSSHLTIVDSKTVQNWYEANFNKTPVYIPYGANIDSSNPYQKILNKYGVNNKKYVLFVGRLVREKGIHYLIEAFGKIKTDFTLVIIGGDPYGKEYEAFLRKNASSNTKFLGYVYGEDYHDLCKGAYLYVTPSDLEGTSPALLTALALGKCVLVSDIPENLETIGDAGYSFKHGNSEDLRQKLQFLLENPFQVDKMGKKAIDRINAHYDWDKIAIQIEKKYLDLLY